MLGEEPAAAPFDRGHQPAPAPRACRPGAEIGYVTDSVEPRASEDSFRGDTYSECCADWLQERGASMTEDRINQSWFLQIDVTATGPAEMCLTVGGELDLATVDLLRRRIRETLELHAPTAITLDLGRLRFIDLAGIRALCELHDIAASVGCRLTLGNVRQPALWLISRTPPLRQSISSLH
ncbi:STAS domain-containing protein [Actinoplanes sp. NPDC024001]|uniref:STAS domain-containing protein n=1 Tax=Actinoplanes sp. NPDC024001 TaxID=3154598 RepID=UPI0034024478